MARITGRINLPPAPVPFRHHRVQLLHLLLTALLMRAMCPWPGASACQNTVVDIASVAGRSVDAESLAYYSQLTLSFDEKREKWTEVVVQYNASVPDDLKTLKSTLDGDRLFVFQAVRGLASADAGEYLRRRELRSTMQSVQGIDDRDGGGAGVVLRGDLCVWTEAATLRCADTDDNEWSEYVVTACNRDGKVLAMSGTGVHATDTNANSDDPSVVWKMEIDWK